MSIKKLLRNQKGFSLIELLIVIGILAILAVIIIPRFADTGDDSREAANSANVSLLQSAVERYHFDTGKYPIGTAGSETISASTKINQDLLTGGKYISEKAENPWSEVTGHASASKDYKLNTNGNVILE